VGFLEPHVGHSGGNGETHLKPTGKSVTVISLSQAKAALAAAEALDVPVVLISAPGAAASAGAGWFDALVSLARAAYPTVRTECVLDCGDAPGHALGALRHGFKIIRYSGANQKEIEEIAEKSGANVLRKRPDALDFEPGEVEDQDLEATCRVWLGSVKQASKSKR
jgi:hypothetical protein